MPNLFNEQLYLTTNPIIGEAVNRGDFVSGWDHYQQFGRSEGLISNIQEFISDQARQISQLKLVVSNYQEQIVVLDLAIAERDAQIAGLNQAIYDKDVHIVNIEEALSQSEARYEMARQTFCEIMVSKPKTKRAKFNNQYYLKSNPDVSKAKINSIAHYIFYGIHEGRLAIPQKSFLAMLPNIIVRHGGVVNLTKKTLTLYSQGGAAAVKNTFARVRSQHTSVYSDVVFDNQQTISDTEFNEAIYLAANPDIVTAIAAGHYKSGREHYQEFGQEEGRVSNKTELGNASAGSSYTEWVRCYDTIDEKKRLAIRKRINSLTNSPLISVLMPVYNPPLDMLEEAIRSVQAQLYPNWELCIADDASTNSKVRKVLKRYADKDARIKVIFRKKNGHISAASNSALELVTGDYLALLDNDDLLPEQALFWIADAIVANPDAGLLYSDEDKIDTTGQRYDPYFKPDWNPDLFLSHNMICHLGVYRTELVRKLGGFREGYEGAQDYDLALRCTAELTAQQIVHIPRVLYHWRSHPGSTAQAGSEKNYALTAGERSLNDHFKRTNVAATVKLLHFGMYRASYTLPATAPLVSLVIPTRNGLDLLKQCIDSILTKTTYKNYEILIVDNNSDCPKALAYFTNIVKNKRIRVLRDNRPFNYSALNNAAIKQAKGQYVALINNDIEVISPEWLTEMLSIAIQPGVGAVGARLLYPNDTLQHGGVITGIGGVAGHSHKHIQRDAYGYFARTQLIQTYSAVTAACLVIKKSIFYELNGLNEENLAIAFNDVDFCLRVREAGYRNVWTPYAELYHHESASRGFENTPEKQARFSKEVLYMKKRWGDTLMNDPAYSPNLMLDREDFSYAWPPRVAK
jgi:glycosyltransferase involved in cell wall biosynthesis